MIRKYSDQVIYIYKIPIWAKIFFFSVLSVIVYAFLTRSSQAVSLWKVSWFGKFLLLFTGVSFTFYAYAFLHDHTVFTKETIYEYTWRGCKETPYRNIAEAFYAKTGRIQFVLKDSSMIRVWVHPSKLDEVIESVTLAGCYAEKEE